MEITTEDIINIIEEEITAVLDEKKKAKTDYSKENQRAGLIVTPAAKTRRQAERNVSLVVANRVKREQSILHVAQLPLHAAQKVKVKNGVRRNETYNRRFI